MNTLLLLLLFLCATSTYLLEDIVSGHIICVLKIPKGYSGFIMRKHKYIHTQVILREAVFLQRCLFLAQTWICMRFALPRCGNGQFVNKIAGLLSVSASERRYKTTTMSIVSKCDHREHKTCFLYIMHLSLLYPTPQAKSYIRTKLQLHGQGTPVIFIDSDYIEVHCQIRQMFIKVQLSLIGYVALV